MANFLRELHTDMQVEYFVDGILCIDDEKEKRLAINSIAEAERNIKDYPDFPTLTHQDCRDFAYRNNKLRTKLRAQIVGELFNQKRLIDDDAIKLGTGGAAPQTEVMFGCKAFYIVGPPAAGKSGIASKIADTYGCYILDSDFAKRKLPEYTNQIGAASLVHEESNELIFGERGLFTQHILRNTSKDNRTNVVIPKIGHSISSIVPFCEKLKELGYDVYLISVDLDRQKATQRAFSRYIKTKRYVPLSLIFDGYGNQPTLNYFKIKQQHHDIFSGFAQLSTDVPFNDPVKLVEVENIDGFDCIDWRK